MRIPNLSRMVARVKVNEALVGRLKGDVTAPTGFGNYYDATHSFSQLGHIVAAQAVPGFHAALPSIVPFMIGQKDVKNDYAHLEEEIVEEGMFASLKVAGLEKPLIGHVKMIAAVASSTDWMSSDVKVYQTVVTIDELVENLKPSMSAEVTVKIDERKGVLRLPIQAVLESGGKKFCYVRTETAIEKRTVNTGLNDFKFIEILPTSEIKEGEQIVLNARAYAEKVNDLQGNVNMDPSAMMKDRGARKGGAGKTGSKTNGKAGTKGDYGKAQGTAPARPQSTAAAKGEGRPAGKERGAAKGAAN
jgi:hypothetical protein